jgi:hydrogenase/urease accessory protein HupE
MTSTTSYRTSIAALTVIVAACLGAASPAFAEHERDHVHYFGWTFSHPLSGLGGLSLAEYLQRHQDRNPDTASVG